MSIPISPAGTSGASQIWSGASAPMSPATKMSNLFDQIDTSGSGTITKSQFEQAFQTLNPPGSFKAAGADAVWSKLDPNGTGSVSKQDFVNGMTTMMKQLRGHHHHGGSAAGAQSLTQNASLLNTFLGSAGSTSNSTSGTPSLLDAMGNSSNTAGNTTGSTSLLDVLGGTSSTPGATGANPSGVGSVLDYLA
ncbi:MAG: EF-hand domain-containing protein [Opitutales bacterium]